MVVRGRRGKGPRHRLAMAATVGVALGTVLGPTLGSAPPAGAAAFESLQWGLSVIGAPTAWQDGTGAGVKIGIVDTGVDSSQQDLQGKVVVATTFLSDPSSGCATAQQDPNGEDDNGHGTHVAGIAAASGRDDVSGVAPSASLVVAKVLDCSGSGEYNDVVSGIDWAVQEGAKVVNLSLGDSTIDGLVDTSNVEGSPLGQALQDAWNAGVVPVIAAGNNSNGLLGLGDADYAGVPAIVVAATGSPANGETDELASYSNGVNEAEWGVAAPGGDDPSGASSPTCVTYNPSNQTVTGADPYEVLSTYWWGPPDDSGTPNASSCYATDEGTSMATPFVTGTVALLLGRGLSPSQVVHTILSTADHHVSCGSDCSGLINAAAAMQAAAAMTSGDTADAPANSATTTTSSPGHASPEPGGNATAKGVGGPSTTASISTPTTGSTSTSTSSTQAARLHTAALGDGRNTAARHSGSTGWLVLLVTVALVASSGLAFAVRRRLAARSAARIS